MVIYDLICDANHAFEGWFKNAEDFAAQQENGMLCCPFCESGIVTKKITAPNVSRKSDASNTVRPKKELAVGGGASGATGGSAKAYKELQTMLGQVHDFIDDNFVDVGNRFAEEALDIHQGNSDEKNIRGTASAEEIKQLKEEGVTALPIPPKPVNKKKLN